MALNPNILLQAGQIESPLLALGRGIQSGQQMAARQQAMQQAQAEQAQELRELQQGDAARLVQGLDAVMQATPDPAQRQALASRLTANLGLQLPPEAFDDPSDFTDDNLMALRSSLATLDTDAKPFQFGSTFQAEDSAGNKFIGTQRRNPNTGDVETAFSSLDGSELQPQGQLQITGAFGLTSEQDIQRRVRTRRGEIEAEQQALPALRAAVKQAETAAAGLGDIESRLATSQATLPGLRDVIGQLKELSDEATFTRTGALFNAAARELGFGSTEGATARASLVSIVDNQVLPLLRPIFGAAFTAAEGDRLRNAFLNPDSGPGERRAALDAFLNQAVRNIDALEREAEIIRGGGALSNEQPAEPVQQPQQQQQQQETFAPAGVDPALWRQFTPAERQAFIEAGQ